MMNRMSDFLWVNTELYVTYIKFQLNQNSNKNNFKNKYTLKAKYLKFFLSDLKMEKESSSIKSERNSNKNGFILLSELTSIFYMHTKYKLKTRY